MRMTLFFALSALAVPALCRAAPWQTANAGLPSHTVGTLVGDDNGGVYALTGRGLFRSRDAGQTWVRLDPVLSQAEHDQRCFKDSPDISGSASPSPSPVPLPECSGVLARTTALAVDAAKPHSIYVAAEGRMYVSYDDGQGWALLPNSPYLPGWFHLLTIAPHAMYAARANGGFAALSDTSGQFKTIDVQLHGLDIRVLHAIAVDHRHSNVVYAANDRGLFVSADGGNQWRPIGEWHSTMRSVAVDPANSTVFASSAVETMMSRDGGANWDVVAHLRGVSSFTFLPGEPTIFAASLDGLQRSDDHGQTWHVDEATDDTRWMSLAVAGAVLLAERSDGHFRSTDHGKSWQMIPVPVSATDEINDIAFDPHRRNVVYATCHDGLYRSVDQGQSWRAITNGSAAAETTAWTTSGKTFFVANHSGVFRSRDGGRAWTDVTGELRAPASTFGVHALIVDPRHPRTLYAGVSSRGVFVSSDEGQSWRFLGDGLPPHDITALAVDKEQNVYVRTSAPRREQEWQGRAGTSALIWRERSDSDGEWPLPSMSEVEFTKTYGQLERWAPGPQSRTPRRLKSVFSPSAPSVGYAVDGGLLYKTNDSGAHWHMLRLKVAGSFFSARSVAIDPFNANHVLVGTNVGVLASNSAGE